MADVFISYKREDKARVAIIAQALEQEGFSVWWDPEIPLGESYAAAIRRELEAASSVLPIWSAQSVASEWVQEEATLGKRKGALVPARIDAVDPPVGFTMTQTADLCGWSGDRTHEEWRRLVEHVAENAKRPARAIPQGYKPPRSSGARRGVLIALTAIFIGVAVVLGLFSSGALSPKSATEDAAATSASGPAALAEIPILGAAMTFRGAEGSVTAAAISPDGTQVAAGDAVGAVRFYEASNALPRGAALSSNNVGSVLHIAWGADAVAVVTSDQRITVHPQRGGEPMSYARDAAITALVSHPRLAEPADATADGALHFGAQTVTLPDGGVARSLAFDAAGRRLIVGGSAGWAYLYNDAAALGEASNLHMPGTSAVRAAFLPDGQRIAVATYGRVVIGPADTWGAQQTVLDIPGDNAPNTAFALSRDGRRVAVALEEKRIYVWDLQRQRLIGRIEVPGGATYLGFTPDGSRLLAAEPDGDASLYDIPAP